MGRFLSLVLRHKPEVIGIKLDEEGWTEVSDLLEKLKHADRNLSMEDLRQIVANNNKSRYAFSEDGTRIRASQGHSVNISLGYQPVRPPEFLYHGTATKYLDSILKTGIDKKSRHHVHLSADRGTAVNVGSRHGKPVILVIHALKMHEEGFEFYKSENDVWLTENVPPEYLVASA